MTLQELIDHSARVLTVDTHININIFFLMGMLQLVGMCYSHSCDACLRGVPNPGIHRLTRERLVFVFSIVNKKVVWNRSCRLVFNKRIIDEKEVVKLIQRDTQERIEIDFSRWLEVKFMKTWIHCSSFCEMVLHGEVQIKLPYC